MIGAALKIAGKRKPVFPCKADKAPYYEKNVLEHGCLDATTDPRKITAWWTRWPEANIGIPTGKASGLFIVDMDTYKPGAMTLAEFEEKYGCISHTATVRTGSGGLQFYFTYPDGEEIRNSAGMLGTHVDTRGEGGYTLAPSSVTTGRYEWINKVPPAPLPPRLLEALRDEPRKASGPKQSRARAGVPDDGGPIHEGERDETLTRIAGRLHDGTRDVGQLEDDLQMVNEARCIPPLSQGQVRKIARSVYRYEPCRRARREHAPETVNALAKIERTLLRGEWKGKGGKTQYSIAVAALKIARQHGARVEDGVRVEVSARQLALAAAVSRMSIIRNLKKMSDVLRPDNENVEDGKSGAIVLLLPPARTVTTPPTEEVIEGGCNSSRAPFTASRLRWSSPSRRPRRGVTPGTCRVRDGIVSKKRDAVLRLGKSCEKVMDSVEAAGGSMPLSSLADALDVKRLRELTRRKNPETGKGRDGFVTRLEDVGVLEVAGDTVALTEDWLEALDRERDRAGEIELYKRDMRRYNEQSEAYRNRHKVNPDHHAVNVGADGFIGDLLREEDDGAEPPRGSDESVISPLADAIRDYLDRNPVDACQPPGWIGSTLWTYDLYPKLEDPAGEVRAAIDELGGETYLRECLGRARGAVA
ncbi:MAG: bifunctional DNA primase/polymerase [Rubrobacter sp.]|jgi:hypothetical protein|nr:bifunctional DNA primase/polymerase [Rubrobacter sp.]